ncbi:MAG: double-strand break repair helicase AddA [Pseudomonadota bacterium]
MAELATPPRPRRPTPEQRAAADPTASVWVGANAGSGKTRVLIERVARLLLSGTAPERILCLTYTKAAAAEMQERLFHTLGDWAMADDAALDAALAALEDLSDGAAGPTEHLKADVTARPSQRLAEARRLFASALETPGGLRIQTIHAFCEKLLRRFPLEAGAAPRFRVADDRTAKALGLEAAAAQGRAAEAGQSDALDRVAARVSGDTAAALRERVLALRDRFPAGAAGPEVGREAGGGTEAALAAHYAGPIRSGPETAAAAGLARLEPGALEAVAQAMLTHAHGSWKKGPALSAALAATAPLKRARALLASMLGEGGKAYRPSWLFGKKAEAAYPGIGDRYAALSEGLAVLDEDLKAVEMAGRAADLAAFAQDSLRRYRALKDGGGWLDFQDLVDRCRDLLGDPGLAPFVLWKLDGGIEHILVDEAQDTSPVQWAVITAIAAEFFAGDGARPTSPSGRPRTFFAVGDEKQSIYSFQGADPEAFHATRLALVQALEGIGRSLEAPALETSFRSAPGILALVDAVFAGPAAQGLVRDATPPRHTAAKGGDALIEIWDPIEPAEKPEEQPWWDPVDTPNPARAEIRLAHVLAREIARIIREDMLPADAIGETRPTRPGDIIVLMRKRGLLARTMVPALKAEGVPVAGADRMVLTDEIAVQDLLAALRVAASPDDDLSLAALLRSPLARVDERALYDLAAGRSRAEQLSARLDAARERHAEDAAFVDDLLNQADFLRPYEMLERILIRHGGRRRLLARLGPEAEDAIDALLDAALAYEMEESPSLTGFLAWIEADAAEVSRRPGEAEDLVRVMTVHGAKGLEAPVVILPDTLGVSGRSGRGPQLLTLPAADNRPGLVLWPGPAAQDDALAAEARQAAALRETAEERRLLYVALTRAERRLLICGAGRPVVEDGKERPEHQEAARAAVWYRMVNAGVERLGGARAVAPPGGVDGARRLGPDPDRRTLARPESPEGPSRAALPRWVSPAAPEKRVTRLTPSALAPGEREDATGALDPPEPLSPPQPGVDGPVSEGHGHRASPLRHGLAVHRLLEHLPGHPTGARAPLAAALLGAGSAGGLDEAAIEAALGEAVAVLEAPFAALLFGPGSRAEAEIAGTLPEGALRGRIDRLVVTPDRVLAVDFKTDATPPPAATAPPAGYLAQLGAYVAALTPLFADRPVAAAIVWTTIPRLDIVNPDAAQRAFAAAAGRLAVGPA